MNDRKNTTAGWILAAGIVGLGTYLVAGEMMHSETPEKGGYAIEGGDETTEGAEADKPIAFYLATADVAAGEQVFKKCASCHSVNQGGANGLGPNLYGVVGKPHGAHPGFAFSDALKGVPGAWTFDAMDAWLKSPRKYAPGTKMTFAGLGNPQDRANVIAYLNAQGSNLPFPPPPAADAAPAAAEGADANATAPADGNAAAPAEGNAAAPANAAAPKL
jgi:cytochrome c